MREAAQEVLDKIYERYAEPFPLIEELNSGKFISLLNIVERLEDSRAEEGLLIALDSSIDGQTTVAIVHALKTCCANPDRVVAALDKRRAREHDLGAQIEIDAAQDTILGRSDFEIVRLVNLVCNTEMKKQDVLGDYSLADLLPDPEEAGEIVTSLAAAQRVLGTNHDTFVGLLDSVADILITQVLKATGDPSVEPTLKADKYGNRIGIMSQFDTLLHVDTTQLHMIRKQSRIYHPKDVSGQPNRLLDENDTASAQNLFVGIFKQSVKKMINYKAEK